MYFFSPVWGSETSNVVLNEDYMCFMRKINVFSITFYCLVCEVVCIEMIHVYFVASNVVPCDISWFVIYIFIHYASQTVSYTNTHTLLNDMTVREILRAGSVHGTVCNTLEMRALIIRIRKSFIVQFTHTRNLLKWQKLHGATEWQDKTQNLKYQYTNRQCRIWQKHNIQYRQLCVRSDMCTFEMKNKYVWWISNVY